LEDALFFERTLLGAEPVVVIGPVVLLKRTGHCDFYVAIRQFLGREIMVRVIELLLLTIVAGVRGDLATDFVDELTIVIAMNDFFLVAVAQEDGYRVALFVEDAVDFAILVVDDCALVVRSGEIAIAEEAAITLLVGFDGFINRFVPFVEPCFELGDLFSVL